MASKATNSKGSIQAAVEGAPLEVDGLEVKPGLWEVGIYLGADSFVYHIVAEARRDGIRHTIISKRPVGEYLRWVDGLFQPGEVPSETSGIHFRAARKLRELL